MTLPEGDGGRKRKAFENGQLELLNAPKREQKELEVIGNATDEQGEFFIPSTSPNTHSPAQRVTFNLYKICDKNGDPPEASFKIYKEFEKKDACDNTCNALKSEGNMNTNTM